MHFKEHVLLHLSNIFYEILDLGPPINAQAHYKSSIFKYNVASTIPNRKESLDLSIFVQKYTIFKYFCYTLYLSD